MKIKKFFIAAFIFLVLINNAISDEMQIDSSNMNIIENGNVVLADNAKFNIPSKKIYIESKKAKYDKKSQILNFNKDVLFEDKENKVIIKGDNINYNRIKDLVFSNGKTKINIENIYDVSSENIFYNRKLNEIYSVKETLIEDNSKNIYILKKGFNFEINNEIIKSKKSIILDKNNNKYIFENLVIDLKNNEIAGKELKVEFEKSYFGNEENDPILKGRSSYSNVNELKVYKAVFSTCDIKDKKCRGWELNTNEFNHDKKKKIFEYKDSWLKLFDYKIFFLPYFNHPDPTIKRKSGFLTPTYSTSETLGTSINIPYFKILSDDRDLTFNPRIYADKSFLLQSEYRRALKNSKILNDFSFLFGEAGSKGHFFYNQIGEYNENTNFELNLQSVEGDNYLKNHKLIGTSPLINDDNLLISNLDLNINFVDSNLSTSFKVFEDLSRNYHDRYQYVFPDFNFSKNIEIPKDYKGKFNFNSYGYNKNYDTNVVEAIITNDFIFSSNQYIADNGLVSDYDFLLKNSNTYSNNSPNFDENSNYDLYGTIKFDTSLPMQKRLDQYINYLRPILSFRYSPNGNNDISSKDILLSYDNVFNLNRIGTSYQVEGGAALSAGLEFKRSDFKGNNIFDFKLGNVIKPKENVKLPAKSKLNKTRTDIFGNANFNINDNLKLGYFFSYDRDLEYSNLEQFDLEYGVNNFITNFSYHTEDNDIIDNKENIKNNSSIIFNDESMLSFEITKDLKEDFTQYYDLIYTYKTDCISINLNYNKSFYRDGNLEPNKSLSFLIKIIPFTELGVPNVDRLIAK